MTQAPGTQADVTGASHRPRVCRYVSFSLFCILKCLEVFSIHFYEKGGRLFPFFLIRILIIRFLKFIATRNKTVTLVPATSNPEEALTVRR